MVMSCMACRITWAPTISASCGRNLLMMSVALAVRPFSSERKPALSAAWADPRRCNAPHRCPDPRQ